MSPLQKLPTTISSRSVSYQDMGQKYRRHSAVPAAEFSWWTTIEDIMGADAGTAGHPRL